MTNLNETERQAQVLQERLKEFSTLSNYDKPSGLPILLNYFSDTTVNSMILSYLVDPALQADLEKAAQSVLHQGFKQRAEIIHPWAGGYTLIAINMAGEIKAASVNPEGGVYQRYGENLFPYALKKAVQRLYLHQTSLDYYGDLEKESNYYHIKDLMGEGKIFLGETLTDPNIRLGQETLAIGASGCELSAEYRNLLAPGMLNDQSDDFAAGYADMVFAKSVARILDPDTARHSPEYLEFIWEPEFFSLLRRAH